MINIKSNHIHTIKLLIAIFELEERLQPTKLELRLHKNAGTISVDKIGCIISFLITTLEDT